VTHCRNKQHSMKQEWCEDPEAAAASKSSRQQHGQQLDTYPQHCNRKSWFAAWMTKRWGCNCRKHEWKTFVKNQISSFVLSASLKIIDIRHYYWRFLCISVSAWNCQCNTSPGVFFSYRICLITKGGSNSIMSKTNTGITPTSKIKLSRCYVK
jgi:hypothetical protein